MCVYLRVCLCVCEREGEKRSAVRAIAWSSVLGISSARGKGKNSGTCRCHSLQRHRRATLSLPLPRTDKMSNTLDRAIAIDL